jgi:RNA polymerase sigma-B factor
MTRPHFTGSTRHDAPAGYAWLAPLFDDLASVEPDSPEHAALREKLITGHLPIADHIARRFANRGETHDDLLQVATLGLVKAVDRFDPARGVDFLYYAVPTIMGEVRKHFRDTGWAIRVTRRQQELHLKVGRATSELAQILGRAPTASQLAAHLDIPVDDVYDGLDAANVYRCQSLDAALDADSDGDTTIGDRIGVEDHAMACVEDQLTLRPLIEALPARERRILMLRFYGNMTQTRIARELGISQMHVSRLLAKTLKDLRSTMDEQASRPEPADADV